MITNKEEYTGLFDKCYKIIPYFGVLAQETARKLIFFVNAQNWIMLAYKALPS